MYHLPSQIGRYEVKTLIGAGGMGSLYLARDTNPNTNRLVALKLLNATLESVELRERFAREARALAALNHPSIVDIYDSGEFQGSPFIVMEYVRGETLAEKIKRKAPLTVGQKLKLMVELCSGLAHAHEAGIIHRDIKPANLMVDRFGRVKILDFGIARMTERSLTRMATQMTQVNVRIGTPGYMSPEQIEGGEIDRRSDIFAVGAVCYELIAYREAFTGTNTRQVENNVLEGRRARLSSIVPDLDPAIEAIIDKALALDPRDRYQDASAFEEALERQRWKLGPEEAPTPAPRSTPAPVRKSGPRPDSRADAAYQRSLAVYEEGAVEAARRFAIEALAEDPDHQDARALIERLGANLWPPPPPSGMRTTAGPTMLATGSQTVGAVDAAAATVLSTPMHPSGTEASGHVSSQRRKALQIAGIVAAVVVLVVGTVALIFYFSSRGPVLTVERPKGGTVFASGIICGTEGTDCAANVDEGEMVSLEQEPDEGYVFGGFEGDCTKTGRVQMVGSRTCRAIYNPLPKVAEKVLWTLTIERPAHGMIIGPGDIRCGSADSACTYEYADGQNVVLKDYADPGYSFRGFTGDCSPKGELVMKGALRCGAVFVKDQQAAKAPPPPVRNPSRSPQERQPQPPTPSPGYTPPTLPPVGGPPPVDVSPVPPPPDASPVTPSKPVAAPLSVEALAKKDIQKLLGEYREAYEALDFATVKKLYPGVPDSVKNYFKDLNALKFAYQSDPEIEPDPTTGTARAKAKVLITPSHAVGNQPAFELPQTFHLVQRQGAWIIEKIERK